MDNITDTTSKEDSVDTGESKVITGGSGNSRWGSKQAIAFAIAFALVGGYLLIRSFASSTSVSLFSATSVPAVQAVPDSQSVELGVKFSSSVAGTVSGIRFYKGVTNTGTHIGNLWTATGTKLASATFSNETASGWQQVNFASPVAIQANTQYVASYFAPAGNYAETDGGFTNAVSVPPLTAPASGTGGPNGLYAYGSASSFPSKGYQASNYWVDVVFSAVPPPDTQAPTVAITSPASGTTVSGKATISGTASDDVGVNNLTVALDKGAPQAVTPAGGSWSYSLDTTSLANAAHTVTVQAYDKAGNIGTATVNLNVSNTVASTNLTVDKQVTTQQTNASSTISSPSFSTSKSNELVLAFLASDGPKTGGQSFKSVTGGGLTWSLRQRSNAQAGAAEIWQAVAPSPLTNVTFIATRANGSYIGSMVVAGFSGADTSTMGAVKTASGTSGAPSVSLTTTQDNAWVWGVGSDYDSATARTLGGSQTLVDQYLAKVKDTYWVQRQTAPTPASSTTVTLNDTNPTNDRWNLAAIEILPAGGNATDTPPPPPADTTPPSAPTNLTATATSASQVNIAWTASTDNVGVTGYNVYRNGTIVTTTTATSYSNTGLAAGTTYSYTVRATDANSNASDPSNTATATTKASADTTPPSTPTNLTATATSASQVNIAWTASTDNTGVAKYLVLRAGSVIATVSAPATSYSDTTVAANTSYSYQIEAQDAAGNTSSLSIVATVKTPNPPDTTPPSVPANLVATAVSSTQANLSWSASTDNVSVAGYTVYRGGTKIGTTTTTSYGDATLTASTTYGYTVSANDGAGNASAQTAAVSVTTPAGSGGGGSTASCPAYPAFPNASCTGVPSGTSLTAYTGSSTLSTAGAVINGKTITTCLTVTAANVSITNSVIKANCGAGYLVQTAGSGSVNVSDTEFDGLNADGHETGLYGANFTCTRCKVHNVGEGFHMDENDTITDSFVYDLFGGGGSHNNAIITNGSGNDTIIHNNLCAVYSGNTTMSGGFCGGAATTYGDWSTSTTGISSSLSLFGDFGLVHDIYIKNNLISTNVGGYCTYGGSVPSKAYPHANHVQYIGNQFSSKFNGTKCGNFGIDADFDSSEPGNLWSGNTWADGALVGQTIN